MTDGVPMHGNAAEALLFCMEKGFYFLWDLCYDRDATAFLIY